MKIQGIPADMRNFQSFFVWNPADFSFQQTKTFHIRAFFTTLKQQLQSKTNSKEWCLLLIQFPYHFVKFQTLQIRHGITKGTHAR